MKTSLDCIPCFARQALEAARFITDDPAIHEQVLRDVLRAAAEMDFSQCPPIVSQQIHRTLRELTGVADPYREIKNRFNNMIMETLPELQARINNSLDPMGLALRLAIAGNVIDLGVDGNLTEQQIRSAIDNTLNEPFHGDIQAFQRAVEDAQKILYLADNAGEIVFDRLLIEQMPTEKITVAVRGYPILNDVTMIDAENIGLCNLVKVIDNGSDAPGTILTDCSEEFRMFYEDADLVIAKGQGNFETLSDEPKNIIFLFKAKCRVIAEHISLPVGTHVATSVVKPLVCTDVK